MAESIQQQMKQITEPKFSPLKIPYFETNFHTQKRGKFTENKVRVLLNVCVHDKIKQIRAFRNY